MQRTYTLEYFGPQTSGHFDFTTAEDSVELPAENFSTALQYALTFLAYGERKRGETIYPRTMIRLYTNQVAAEVQKAARYRYTLVAL